VSVCVDDLRLIPFVSSFACCCLLIQKPNFRDTQPEMEI